MPVKAGQVVPDLEIILRRVGQRKHVGVLAEGAQLGHVLLGALVGVQRELARLELDGQKLGQGGLVVSRGHVLAAGDDDQPAALLDKLGDQVPLVLVQKIGGDVADDDHIVLGLVKRLRIELAVDRLGREGGDKRRPGQRCLPPASRRHPARGDRRCQGIPSGRPHARVSRFLYAKSAPAHWGRQKSRTARPPVAGRGWQPPG